MSNKTRVMIVDDNREFVRLLTMYINTQEDMEVVHTAFDGQDIINSIKENEPDILLLDIIMPERDGLSVLEDMIKNQDVNMPITVVMSAIGQEKITQKAIALELGISQQTYSDYEKGKYDIPNEMILKIADYYKVSIDYLFERTI